MKLAKHACATKGKLHDMQGAFRHKPRRFVLLKCVWTHAKGRLWRPLAPSTHRLMHPGRVRGDVDYINASTTYERSRMPLRSAQDMISAEPSKLYVVFFSADFVPAYGGDTSFSMTCHHASLGGHQFLCHHLRRFTVQDMIDQAIQYLLNDSYEESRDLASRSCDTDPNTAKPHRLLGELCAVHLGWKSLAMEQSSCFAKFKLYLY